VAVVIVAWALLVPPFSVPDETAHFSYTQSLAETGERPPQGDGNPDVRLFSTEEQIARRLARDSGHTFGSDVKPAWEPAAERAWRQLAGRLPRDDSRGTGPQANHPPLYYAYEVLPYAATPGGDLFDRLFLMRLWSGLLMLVTAAGAWLLVGELVRDRRLQLAGAACAGLQPMATFVSAGVNPDALLFAAFAVALWLAVRVARRGPSRGALVALPAVTLVAVLTKPAGLALVPPVAVALIVALLRARGGRRALPSAMGAAALAVALVAVLLTAGRGAEDRVPVDLSLGALRGFATYLWDFYLPRLPFQRDYGMPDGGGGWNLHEQTWAAFGYLEVRLPDPLYVVLLGVVVATFAGAGAALLRRRVEIDRPTLAIFALTILCLAAGLHWRDFHAIRDGGGHVIQGRYFLPLMPIVAVAVAAALANLPGRLRAAGAALVLGGIAALQLASLSITAGRFFA
jgi:4-amino-4-deoxy-L-arabinose transferase-like glycosyltransferase